MSETSDAFRISLGAQIDTKNITDQIQGMKPPKITLDIDTKDLKTKIQSAVNEAYKSVGVSNIKGSKISLDTSAIDNLKAKATESIKLKIDIGDFDVKIKQLEKGFKDTGLSAEETQRKIKSVVSAYDDLKSASPEQLVAVEKRLNQELNRTQNQLKIARIDASGFVSTLQTVKLSNKIQSWLKNNTAATKEAKLVMQQYLQEIELSGGKLAKVDYQRISSGYDSQNTLMRQMGKLGNSSLNTLREGMSKFTNWIGASAVVMKAINETREGINTIKELDDGLTNINYTMEVTSSQLKDIGNSSVSMAKDLHTSTANVLSAVKLYANANETANSILEKAKPAVMLSNITGKSGEDEAKNLQAMQNQFQLADDELMGLTDTIETISANMSYDFADGIAQITEGIQQSGAAAKAAGMDYKRYMALLGAGIESTGLSGSQLANAYKTMMARTTSASKASIANGEVTEDDISNAEKSLRSVNIEVRETNDSFYDFDQTMGAIYEKLDELSEVDLSKLAYDVAGVRQSSIFRSMIQSYGTYLNLAKEAENSQGKALEVQEKQAESIKGRLGELKSTGESVWNNVLNSGELKAGVDTLTVVLKLLDGITGKLHGMGTVGLGLGAFLGAKNAGILQTKINEETGKTSFFPANPITSIKDYFTKSQISQDDFNALKNFNVAMENGASPIRAYTDNMKNAGTEAQKLAKNGIVAAKGITDTSEAAMVAKVNLDTLTTSSKATEIGLKALRIAGNMLLALAISEAISLVIKGVDYLIHRNEKLIESANEVTNTYREQSKTLNDNVISLQKQKDEFNRLSQGVDDYGNNISLTSDEYDRYKSIVSEILGYTPELIAGYDEEGNAIAKKNGLIEQSIELMKEEQRQKLKEMTSDENTKTVWKGAKAEYDEQRVTTGKQNSYQPVTATAAQIIMPNGQTNTSYTASDQLELVLEKLTGSQKEYGENWVSYLKDNKAKIDKNYDEISRLLTNDYESTNGDTTWTYLGLDEKSAENIIKWLKDTYDSIADLDKLSHGMDDQFSLYAQKSDHYEELTDAQKHFVNEYIKATGSIIDAEGNFLSADKIQEKANGFTDFVDEIVTNDKFKEAREKMNDLFSLDKSKLSASDYEQQVNAVLDFLVKEIDGFEQDDANKIKISLGFEFLSDGSTRVGTLIDDVKGKLKDEFKGKVDNMTLEDLVDASKLEIPEGTLLTWDEFIEKMAEAKATASNFNLDSFNKSIDDIQSAYNTLTKAKDEWNKNGAYSLDTVQALLALEPKYLAMLVNENGQLKLNEQAMYNLINAQLEEAKSKIYQNGINQLNALISEKTGEASKEAAQDKANSVIDINAETEALGLNTEAKLQNIAATARGKGVSDEEINKIVDETIRQANTIQSAVDGMTIDFDGVVGGFSDAKDKLHELDKKISLENLKNEIEKCSLAIEKLDKDISNLDLAIDFLDDNDYAGRADLLAQKLQLLTNKGASLKAEFEQLANTTPHSADEAEAIASRLSTIGDALRSNLKDWVEYTKELEQNKVQALVDSITDVDTDKISEIGDVFDAEIKKIENAIKRLNGETLFGDVSFFSAIMPEKPKESNSEKQKNNYSEQIAELQKYEDRVYAIQKQALDMQYAENQAAWAKERQELTNSLSDQEQELRKAKNTALNTQDKYNQESEKKTKEFSQNTKNVVTDLNTWMGKNPISAPLLDTSKWEGLVKNAEDYAKRVKDAFNTPPISASAKEAVTNARQSLGTPYVWGGETTSGWDCSGFVNYIYGGENVTGGRTTQVQWASNNGTRITDLSQLQDGDVIYFRKSQGSDDISHVAIYTGNGKMIHAKGKDYGTVEEEISPTYWRRMIGAKRFYAKGTKDFSDINGWAGENNKPELLIDKNNGKITRITSLTPINTNKVDVIGEDDTARIEKGLPSYATGTVDPMDIAKYIRTNYPEITNAAIAGILGNIYAESNFNQFAKTVEAYGSGSNRQVTRWGLFQLDDERIPNWSNIVASGNWQKQIDTVLAEGRYQNSGMGNSQKHNMWQYITDTSLSASDIASLWDKLYERSDGSTRSKRVSKAEEFYANDLANNFDFSDTTTRVANKLATETVNKYQQYVDQVAKRYSPSSESISENIDYFKNDEFRQAKINEYKEKFEANPQSLNDYIQAIEYANKATAQSTIEFYDAETKIIIETADKYKTAHKELQEAYTQVGQGLQDAINNGESQEKIDAYYDELKQIVEATQDLESKMESVDSQWQSMIDSIVEFHKTVTDRHILEFNPEQWYADKDLEEAELNYSRQNRYTTQIETLNEVNAALENQVKLHSRLMGSITDEANKVRNEYSELYSVFTSEEIEGWFNPDGSLSENYNQVLELYANNPEVLTLIKEFGQALSYNKTQYIQYQDEQKKFIDQVYDNQRTLHQHQLDMAMQVAENIQGVHNKIIASLQKEEDLLNRQLNNTSKFSQKQDISENLLDNYRAQQQEQYNSKAEYENELKALMARSEYADIISKFDTSKWLNTNGELTAYYYSDLDNKSLISSVDEWETAKGLGELMSKWSTAISASETAILDLNDSIKSVTDDMYQQQIDAVNTAIDTVVQMIEKRKERELKALEQVHNKRIEQLQEESEFIQEAYNRATSLLDDIKSEEDYEKQLSDEQKVADNLQAQIAEYSLDDSDGAKQRVLELQKQLNEQLEKIDDLKREHEYEQTKKALNDDLEAYNKYWDEIQESEDDQYQHNQELIEARYTEETKYHEAIRVLQSGTFDDFTSKGVYAYETIYSKGNQVALDLTDAYDSFATETGTKFQNLGLEFKNITALLEHNIELIDIFNSKAQDWNVDTNTTYTDHTGNDYYNNITKPNNSSLGRDEGVVKNYNVSETASLEDTKRQMKVNSQAWLKATTQAERDRLHAKNEELAKEINAYYDADEGRWYRNGIPLYHTGRISKESQQAFDIINDTLKPNEEFAILKTNENVITKEQMQEWAKGISLHTPSLSSIPDSVSHGLRALDKSMHSATNNLESNTDNSKHLNIEKISIGANNAVTKSDVKNGVFGAMKKVDKSR